MLWEKVTAEELILFSFFFQSILLTFIELNLYRFTPIRIFYLLKEAHIFISVIIWLRPIPFSDIAISIPLISKKHA